MKPLKKPFFIAILVLTSVLLVGCNLRRTGSGSGSGSGTGSGSGGGPTMKTIGGTVIGLAGTGLVLVDNTTDTLTINANGPFTFSTAVFSSYAVTIKTQPANPSQTCAVSSGTGTATNNITNIQINCGTSGLTIGGSVSGLIGSGLVLQNNGSNDLQVTGTGNVTFTFSSAITPNTPYAVTVLTPPSNPSQSCFVANGTGTVIGNVTNIQVTCSQPSFTIGGSVVGLVVGPGDTLELQDNAGDDLFVTGDTIFTFPTQVTYGGIYNVQDFLPPTSQPQACNDFFYTGIALNNISSVVIDCQHNDWDWFTWTIPTTKLANNYASITTPLFPVGVLPPANFGTPGGRDFAASWTDKQGRKWLFGGNGFPYPSPVGKQLPGFLNDLWVFDGTWVPANLPTFVDKAGDWVVDPGPMEVVDGSGLYGTLHTFSNGFPGARWGSSTWTDPVSGNLWLFGGQGVVDGGSALLNDVWEWIPGTPPSPLPLGSSNNAGTFTGQWIWQGGSNSGAPATLIGVYGVKGTGSTANLPGGRWAAASQTDSLGNVWLFGGQGIDSAGTTGLLSDLWKYNINSGQWTWVAGSNLAGVNGVYGTKGSATGGAPGGRQAAVLWVDASNNVWLFGGFGFDSAGTNAPEGAILNDLWEFTGGQWVWVSGGNLANQTGTYGTQAVSNPGAGAAANVPGSRWGAAGWSDANSNLWFYGGWGYGSANTNPTGFLNDIWEYQASTGQWVWWKGTSNANQSGLYSVDGLANGLPFVKYVAGARRGTSLWPPNPNDPNGYVWVFGGEGYDSTQGAPPGYLNDVWTYLPFP
jgi:hypothetical protein